MQIDELIKFTEKSLSIILPIEYIICTKDGIFNMLYKDYEIYFLDDKMINLNTSPCAIGVTKKFREEKILPKKDSIALANIDDKLYFLNTNNNFVCYENKNIIFETKQTLFKWMINIVTNKFEVL